MEIRMYTKKVKNIHHGNWMDKYIIFILLIIFEAMG